MSFDVNRLRAMASNLEDRSKTVWAVYPLITELCFFIGSYVVMTESSNYLDRAAFVVVGLIFGRMFGTLAKHTLEERHTILAGYLELYDMVNKTPASPVKLPETVPSEASEAVAKVEIPAEPNLPNIPSVAAPEEVKAALKAGKAKGKPTRLPPKRKAKTVPPVSQA